MAIETEGPRCRVEKDWAQIGFDQQKAGKTFKMPAGMTECQKQMVIWGWNAAKNGVEKL